MQRLAFYPFLQICDCILTWGDINGRRLYASSVFKRRVLTDFPWLISLTNICVHASDLYRSCTYMHMRMIQNSCMCGWSTCKGSLTIRPKHSANIGYASQRTLEKCHPIGICSCGQHKQTRVPKGCLISSSKGNVASSNLIWRWELTMFLAPFACASITVPFKTQSLPFEFDRCLAHCKSRRKHFGARAVYSYCQSVMCQLGISMANEFYLRCVQRHMYEIYEARAYHALAQTLALKVSTDRLSCFIVLQNNQLMKLCCRSISWVVHLICKQAVGVLSL
jgi:hypothetical protein